MNPLDFKEQIKITYLSNIDSLPGQKQRHFIHRLKVSEGNLEASLIEKYVTLITKESVKKVQTSNWKVRLKESLSNKTPLNPGDQRKYEAWINNFDLYVLYKLLVEQHYTKHYSLKTFNIKKDYLIEKIRNVITNRAFLRYCTTQATCIIYYSYQIFGVDFRDEFIQNFYSTFSDSQRFSSNTIESRNFIYGLTHIIIGESNFYTISLENNSNANTAAEALVKYEPLIKNLNRDIIAEYLLALHLINRDSNKFQFEFFTSIEKEFIGYFPRINNETANIINSEHLNIVIYLLLHYK